MFGSQEAMPMARTERTEETPQPPGSLLLVDDDVELCELLQEYFTQRGFRLAVAHDGRRGLACAM
jgi:ActR/RegA family two-component response regulator